MQEPSPMSFSEVMRRSGDPRQVWGVLPLVCEEGRARGSRILRVRSGGGLELLLLPDRALDVYELTWRGTQLAWLTPVGPAHPAFYDPTGWESHRAWPGGFFTSCGLRKVGHPEDEDGEHFPLHGRLQGQPAEAVQWSERPGDPPQLSIRGLVRECEPVAAHNLLLSREYLVPFGGDEFTVRDRIENLSHREEEVVLVYHVNFGHPLLSEHTRLVLRPARTEPFDEESARGLPQWSTYEAPRPDAPGACFFHELSPESDGRWQALLTNPVLGVGVELSALASELPCLTQWKRLVPHEYVAGVEPGTAWMKKRPVSRAEGRLIRLGPEATHEVSLRFRVLCGDALTRCEQEISGEPR